VLQKFVADARGGPILGVLKRDIGDVDRPLLGDDPALLRCGLTLMAPDHGDAPDDDAVLRRHHLDHFALLALVLAGDDDHVVALPDLELGHHSTSGASDTIFMCFLALSSRVTGPKMRVPIGSPCGLTSTAALRSKRMIEPSGRRTPLAVRTTTAFITWPFFTRPRGIASLTETTMVSPIPAYFRFDPPSTLMHWTRRAPELSATSRLVCIWIMTRLSRRRPRPSACAWRSGGFLRCARHRRSCARWLHRAPRTFSSA